MTSSPAPMLPGFGPSVRRGVGGARRPGPPRDGPRTDGRDAFYTRAEVAARCVGDLVALLPDLDVPDDPLFVEPSAGAGAFYDNLPPGRRIGLDIAPAHPEVRRRDFLAWTGPRDEDRRGVVVVGNPPFGARGRLALQFVRHSARFADTIGFILPLSFRKYALHRRIPPRYRWIFADPLPEDSFRLPNGRPYRVGTEFQIWTRHPSRHTDRRLLRPAPIRHDHFEIWQYNNTPQALRVFGEDFEFGVPCQGWQDYNRRETDADACEKHKQWMLIRPRTALARKRLFKEIDYGALAHENGTRVPGFRKSDLVRTYISRYERDDATTVPPNRSHRLL